MIRLGWTRAAVLIAVVVFGLTSGTAYTFTATATNALGTSAPSAASNSVTSSALLPTTITVSSSAPTQSLVGTPVTFTATVMPLSGGGTLHGNVMFEEGYQKAVRSLNDATWVTAALSVGTHTIIASYTGDETYQSSTTAFIQVVSANPACMVNGATNADLVEHYYTAILRRPSEAGGQAYWMSESDRVCGLGADPKEAFMVLANVAFNSPEYLAFNRDDNGFVTDLYNALFSRLPDAGGWSYWLGQLSAGMSRDNVISSFLFSPEFTVTMNAAFPGQTALPDTYVLLNLYGGLLREMADTAGYNFWTRDERNFACPPSDARWGLQSTIRGISNELLTSADYVARATTNSQYVSDLYYALLQRGAEPAGYNYWVDRLNAGVPRGQMQQILLDSAEMSTLIAAIAAQGCLP